MSEEMKGNEHEPATRGDLRAMRSDFKVAMKGDVTAMRSDISDFKVAMRGEFKTMRDEIVATMREQFRPIIATLAHHSAELADIRGHIKDKMVTRDEFHSRMDGYAGLAEDSKYLSAKNLTRLDEHEKRIKALEEKSA